MRSIRPSASERSAFFRHRKSHESYSRFARPWLRRSERFSVDQYHGMPPRESIMHVTVLVVAVSCRQCIIHYLDPPRVG